MQYFYVYKLKTNYKRITLTGVLVEMFINLTFEYFRIKFGIPIFLIMGINQFLS